MYFKVYNLKININFTLSLLEKLKLGKGFSYVPKWPVQKYLEWLYSFGMEI